MKTIYSIFFLFFLLLNANAQPLKIDPDVFAKRRAVFMTKMDSNTVAIFTSKPVYIRNSDIEYQYRQESNFYYLSGFEEPESILLINPSDPKYKFILFVRKRNRRRETYEGPRAGIEGAMTTYKADTAFFFDDFHKIFGSFLKYDSQVYYMFGINPEYDDFFKKYIKDVVTLENKTILNPAPILAQMRVIKNEGDWKMGLKKAIDISAEAHIEAMKTIKPGLYEYEIQAIIEYVFRKNGSPRNGYPCIVGSGPNSTILHYNLNNRMLKDGDMILMDCGAEYGYYSADITRSVPVNGKFTKEQKDIYEIVLNAQKTAIELVKPGIRKSDVDEKMSEILGTGLLNLGFIKDKNDHRIFSLHGYGHWIGLEVHDVGAYTKNGESVIFQPGMVLTFEPGIYIRPDVFDKMKEKGYTDSEIQKIRSKVEKYIHIGVRVEDDILVTESGFENLSKAVPKEIDEIEKLMH